MRIKFLRGVIELKKNLNSLDQFVISFTSILNKLEIKYVIVSGYVSILFGRNRASEDIDLFAEKMTFNKFERLWKEITKEFECINALKSKTAFNEYISLNHALRFSKKGTFIPNIELKFPKVELDDWTLEQRKEVLLNKQKIFISPLELQISYKLFLGSEKDIEDARFLYKLLKGNIDLSLLKEFNKNLKIEALFNKYLK